MLVIPDVGDPRRWRRSPDLQDPAGAPPLLSGDRAVGAAGVAVTYRELRGAIHGFASDRRVIPSAGG